MVENVQAVVDETLDMAPLDEVLEQHPVDRSRIYLTGLSMGGTAPGAWGWRIRSGSQPWCRSAAGAIR